MKLKKTKAHRELLTVSRGVVRARPLPGDFARDTGIASLNRALDKLEKLIGRPS